MEYTDEGTSAAGQDLEDFAFGPAALCGWLFQHQENLIAGKSGIGLGGFYIYFILDTIDADERGAFAVKTDLAFEFRE
jgi:hypothetical protein